MTTTTVCNLSQHVDVPCINRVEAMRPLVWLRKGAGDFARAWPWTFVYGVVFAVAGFLIVNGDWARPALAMTLSSGFLLAGPFLAIGFYDLSLRNERERMGFPRQAAFSTVKRNLVSIGLFGVLLAFIFSVWERISAILVGLYLGTSGVPEAGMGLFLSRDHLDFLLLYAVFAVLLSLAVFSLSVVSLPMLMDRQIDIVTALITSLWVVWENRITMLVWGIVIVSLIALAALSWFAGLAIIFPILGHATWHAYRDLVAA